MHRRILHTFAFATLCQCGHLPSLGWADEAAAPHTAAAVSDPSEVQSEARAAEIAQWAADLDSGHYETRENAQKRLREAGAEALDEVARLVHHGSLESSTRALNVLLDWAESKDTQLAIAALENLAELEDRPREATYAARILGNLHERRALEELAERGAVFQASQYGLVINRMPIALPFQVLIGKDWKGGSDAFALLANVPRITHLSLYSPPVDDEALEHILKLPNLQKLDLYGTQFSPAAIERVRQRVGVVDVRQGAFLGIKGQDTNVNAVVMEVVPGGAAAKAGIQAGDVITHFGSEPVRSFQHLTELIGAHKEGDSAQLTVFRNPQGAMQARIRQLQQGNGRIQMGAPGNPAGNNQGANPPAVPPPQGVPAAAPEQAKEPDVAEEPSAQVIEMTVKFDRWSITGQQALVGQEAGNVNDLPLNPLPRPHYERR